ncbi:S41 family peptidase [Porphyromonas gingivalis]|uniref:S41 family peptidase n=1 Tax=Porphyromonas gingivalis TaxID=837 RepID=UPI000BE7671F|nr:S41 family peptidase [Porphyromonas gingivalis]PDP73399.1 peptidase S41 [Porphyromonas gingivalis]RZQ66200.1 S41 family peptidase [Porphyromonas gingivalis]
MNKASKSIILLLLLGCSASAQKLSSSMKEALRKLETAVYAISSLYVDSVDNNKLTEYAIRGVLSELDPHSVYSDAEETKSELEPLNAGFDGIGVQFNMLTDTVYVVQVIAGGPSEKAGLLAGDRIVSVDDTVIAGVKMKTNDVMKRLRGPRGSKVKLGVWRGNDRLNITVKRGLVPVHSREACYMVDGRTGYIRLSRFSRTTYDEFAEGIALLRGRGMQQLVLDLRFNGGGILDQAVEMAGTFLPEGSTVLTVRNNRMPRISERMEATSSNLLPKDLPLVVLVNEFSASASEILAGAIQDWDRGVVIGRRTFGKGLVQRPLPFQDGSMIRLTIARYYTPSGRSIQKPYAKGNFKAYEQELIGRFKHGESIHSDSIRFPDSLRYKTLVTGRTVYGGGGIMPDLFIPTDTALFNKLHRELLNKGVFNRAVLKYVDAHRQKLRQRFPDRQSYATFSVPEELTESLKAFAEAEKITWSTELFAEAEELIKCQLHAYIARDILGENDFFYFFNRMDKEYIKALDLLNDPDEYKRLLGK